MDTNEENKNELATPISFGTALGFLASPLGPSIALPAAVRGMVLGFWYDKKYSSKVPAEHPDKDTSPRQ